ncbi:MAG TPA: hypothetical protein VIU62_10915 [Chloroflexota bacterium]|jgi:hypothetical protein
MQPPLTVVAEMLDGACIVEHVFDFKAFVAVVLPFRRDPDCLRVTWHTTPEPPEPVLYESSGACPWNQTEAQADELVEADYQRWAPTPAATRYWPDWLVPAEVA